MEEGWGGEGVAHVFQRCYCVWIVFVTPLVLVLSGVVTFFKNQFSGGRNNLSSHSLPFM